MEPKGHFYIGARGGLVDRKHYDKMGDAVWLFLWLVLRQTQLAENGEGVVLYGNPIRYQDIRGDTGFTERTLQRWMAHLQEAKYIRVKIRRHGLTVWIAGAKKRNKCETRSARLGGPQSTKVRQPWRGSLQNVADLNIPKVNGNNNISDFPTNTSLINQDNATKLRPKNRAVPFFYPLGPKNETEIEKRKQFLLSQKEQLLAKAKTQ